jgi:hypothetical protein
VQSIHYVNRLLDKGIFSGATGAELTDDEGNLLKHKIDS